MIMALFCETALLSDGWHSGVRIEIGPQGTITALSSQNAPEPGDTLAKGPVLPTLANCHSHAFQRAMAGLAEIAGSTEDSFWTWRVMMYRLAGLLTPDDMQAVAAKLYSELLKGGFGRVTEFHYVHHQADGAVYATHGETSLRILKAAEVTGIGLTHLPVFYAQSGFGGAEPHAGQRPFLHTVDGFLTLLDSLRTPFAEAGATLGAAIHSLRAATPEQMQALLEAGLGSGPIHIHVGEQEKEVEDCLAWSGRRPVEWMLDELPVDHRWCAIHATHMTETETSRLAASGAVAGLCPATEANLGDGIFPATQLLSEGGRIAIGTDSHVATSVAEELRLLEYGQRLRDRRRNRLVAGAGSSAGRTMIEAALKGGAQAAGQTSAGLAVGAPADLLVLDGGSPYLAEARGDQIIDRWIFALGAEAVRDVMIAGCWRIEDRRHTQDEAIDRAFAAVLRKIG
ncbi:formimidoylglutamate deiminase [Rhizobium sp. YIM 134829]|uniref:formimidoylglutamate deiminase n=1 Tax=Rhizobium sp. YIM 134829 TaxID=3390453 RepID=UPI00397DE22E